MDIRGLVLVNSESIGTVDQAPRDQLAGILDVVGKSALRRTVERLQQYGISSIGAVVETPQPFRTRNDDLPADVAFFSAAPERFWRTAENVFNDMAQSGAELVVLVRLGGYAEADFEKLVQFHIDRQGRVTQMTRGSHLLDIFCISASRRNDAASLFRTQLMRCRSECPLFLHEGYFIAVAAPGDTGHCARC